MGGEFLSFKAKTKEELKKQVDVTILHEEWRGMFDVRGIRFFPPLTYVNTDGTLEEQWTVFLWIHS